jgi:Flp pilus assembly protein TadG
MIVRPMSAGLARRWRLVAVFGDAGSSTVEAVMGILALFAVLMFIAMCGRLVSAQIDVDAAASAAARAGSLARGDGTARAQADSTARETLADRGVTCRQVGVSVTTGGLRPGGAVTVTVTCSVALSDLGLLLVPGSRTVQGTSTSPIDQWRARALGFGITEAPSAANSSMDGA